MPYRSEFVERVAGSRSVVEMALEVHMFTVGTAERSPADNQRDILALKEVVETWHPSRCSFDTCVLNLIVEALAEAKAAGFYPKEIGA